MPFSGKSPQPGIRLLSPASSVLLVDSLPPSHWGAQSNGICFQKLPYKEILCPVCHVGEFLQTFEKHCQSCTNLSRE